MCGHTSFACYTASDLLFFQSLDLFSVENPDVYIHFLCLLIRHSVALLHLTTVEEYLLTDMKNGGGGYLE